MLRPNTANSPSKARLLLKSLMFPGTNWVSRDKSRLVKMLLTGTPDRPVRTLDCGCGNAYFSHQAVLRGAECLGITIHEWEKENCEAMRDYLGIPEDAHGVPRGPARRAGRRPFGPGPLRPGPAARRDRAHHGCPRRRSGRSTACSTRTASSTSRRPTATGRRTPRQIRVTRVEDGWHVRNGYTFEQLEAVLDDCGFEPIDRLRFGTLGSTVVTWIQHNLFGSWIDPLTVLFFPLLKALAVALSPWRDSHTIFVLARKKRATLSH